MSNPKPKKGAARCTWSAEENERFAATYAHMLLLQQHGKKFAKAPLRRDCLARMCHVAGFRRSDGSFEAKAMNASAVLASYGLDYVKGYKPLGNAQKALTDALARAIPELAAAMQQEAA